MRFLQAPFYSHPTAYQRPESTDLLMLPNTEMFVVDLQQGCQSSGFFRIFVFFPSKIATVFELFQTVFPVFDFRNSTPLTCSRSQGGQSSFIMEQIHSFVFYNNHLFLEVIFHFILNFLNLLLVFHTSNRLSFPLALTELFLEVQWFLFYDILIVFYLRTMVLISCSGGRKKFPVNKVG